MRASAETVMLLVGFTAGQVQLIDPIKKELSKLYNEEVCFCIYGMMFLGLDLFRVVNKFHSRR